MDKKITVVPAVLTDNPQSLKDMLGIAATFTGFVQIDIMDGLFVPSKSITATDICIVKTGLKWEAHLMVNNPENLVDDFASAGAQQIIFHYEATESHGNIIDMVHGAGLKAGIAVNPDTDISVLDPLINKLDSVLFMSVVPGYYGSKFIPEVLDKITDFRNKYPHIYTGIDGGIKENNIATVAKTGVNSICVGSAVFCQDNPAQSYRRLESLCNT
ncbi:MAG: ribulose-phosphate 3-epimerase [Dehalococcoidales bacterium]|nr:ribulose-phosphate 3-epimerase [Dehalococcoidales bacterium]